MIPSQPVPQLAKQTRKITASDMTGWTNNIPLPSLHASPTDEKR
jgi:hypothetical protein